MADIKLVTNADSGTADIVGGDDWDDMATKVNNYANAPPPASYTIWKSGSNYYAQNGTTKVITFNATASTLINAVLTAMASTGGLVHFAAGTYSITAQLNIPQHVGLSYTIEGEGWRNTLLEWTGAASDTDYLLESYASASGHWQAVTFKDLQFSGGSATNNRLVKVLHLGRGDAITVPATYTFHNVRVRNGKSPQILANHLQDSFMYFLYCESSGSTPTAIVDLDLNFASHCNLFGCNMGAIEVNESRLNAFGGTMQYLKYEQVGSYQSKISGVFFDPIPVGFTHQIQVGTTGNVVGVEFDNIGFSGDTNTPSTDRYFYINDARNVVIRLPKFKTSHTLTKTIEFTSSATGCFLYLQNQEDLTKVQNDSTSTTIFNPYPTGMTIVAATNTITDTSAASGDFLKHDGTRFVRNIPKSVGTFFLLAVSQAAQTLIFPNLTGGVSSATESVVDNPFTYAFTVKRFRLVCHSNTKNAATTVSFRDDGADVTGTNLSIGAGATGEFDSGALSVAVAAGSKINWKIDATASASGALVVHGWIEYEILLQ